MKQSLRTHKPRTAATGSRKAPAKTVRQSGMPRSARSNHTCINHDRGEQQAHAAANKVLRGERGVVSSLSPAPAASFSLPGSSGRPLPGHLRLNLETGFGAELSAVRIHDSQDAHRIVRWRNAKAFTAGSHIYFGEGFYQPHSHSGRRLIAHEVSHVLQQTARPANDGAVRARDIRGSGEVQRDELFDDMLTAYRAQALETPSPVEPTTRDQRQRALEQAIALITEITGSGRTLDHSTGSRDQALLLEQAILNPDSPDARQLRGRLNIESRIVRSFIYDSLKLLGRHEGAAKMVDDEPDLPSFVRQGETTGSQLGEYYNFLVEHEDYGFEWFYPLIEEIPDVNWPYSLLQNLWTYLTRPERRAQSTREYDRAYQAMSDENGVTGFGINERQIGARVLLQAFNRRLTDYLQRLDTRLGTDSNPSNRKQLAARQVIADWQEVAESSRSYESRFARNIRETAEAALRYWEQVQEMHQLSLRGGGEQLPEPPELEIVQRFIGDVISQSRRLLFSREEGIVVPTQEEYQESIRSFIATMRGYQATDTNAPQPDTLAHHLEWNRFRFEHRNREEAIQHAVWLGWAIRWSESLVDSLSQYDAQRDQQFRDEYHRDDIRRAHRLQMARFIWNFALATRNADMREAALMIQRGEDVASSYILLTGEWRQDEAAEIEQMNEDFMNTTVRGLGIRTHQLVSIFRLLHLGQFNQALRASLLSHETDLSGGQRRLVGDAVDAADESITMPTRWRHTDYEIVWHTIDGEQTPDTPVQDLLRGHNVFTDFRDAHVSATGGSVIIPWGYRNDVFAWKLPSQGRLIRYLRGIPVLDERVLELAGLSEATSDLAWFDAFSALVEEGMDSADGQSQAQRQRRSDLLGLVASRLSQDASDATALRNRLLRRATTHRRRVLVDELNPAIQQYVDGDISDYVVPNRVLDAIETFIFYVQPRDADAGAQEAALTLGVAEKLKNMFVRDSWFGTVRERRYDLVTGYYGAIERTIQMVQDNPDAIRAVLFIPENLTAEDRQHYQGQGVNFENAQQLLDNISHLETVMESLNQVISSVQETFGFQSADGSSVKSLQFAHEFNLNEPIEIQGHRYLVTDIANPFRFHPPYGERTDAERQAQVNDLDGNPLEENSYILTLVIDSNEPLRILNDDEGRRQLQLLNDVLGIAGFVASLENLEQLILDAGELGLDIAELIPGVGQGVMAARALYAVSVFIAQDLPDIKQRLFEDPAAILEEILEFVSSELPYFVEVLMFGELPFENRLMVQEEEESDQSRGRRRGAGRRLRQLFEFVKAMVEDAMFAFVRLRGRIRGSFVAAQGRILSNRALLMFIEALPTLIAVGRDAIELNEALGVSDFDELEERLQEEMQDILNAFSEIELPEDIIPLDIAVDVLLSFGLSRLPGRKGQVIAEILELTGATSEASRLIAEALNAGGANPNIIWREEIRSQVQPQLEDAQRELSEAVSRLISDVTDGRINLNPDLQTPSVAENETVAEIPETEGKLKEGSQEDLQDEENRPLVPPPKDGGKGLDRRLKRQFLREFGHDFGHVRLHRDAGARGFTRSANAHALTSGSHIYLNDHVNPDSSHGQYILRHELSHVLQQTGPRPAGKRHHNNPVPGKAGAGLQRNLQREVAADRMAEKAANRQDSGPLAVEVPGGEGWLPNMSDVAITMLDNLTEEGVAEAQAETFEQSVPRRVTRKSTFNSAVQDARQVWNAIKSKLQVGGSDVRYTAPLDLAQEQIKTYLRGSFSSRLNNYIDGIVLRSSRTLDNGRVRLRHGLFVNNLETYIFASTGLVVSVDMDGERVDDIHVRYLHLGNLHAGTDLWSAMKVNTERLLSSSEATHFSGRGWGRVREIIATRSHEKAVWHASEFRLNPQFVTEVVGILSNLGNVQIAEWDEYRNPNLVNSRYAGLRVSTHGNLTAGGTMPDSARAGRESHHIPQYLLVEFFRNNASTALFTSDDDRVPGFYPHRRRFSREDDLTKFSTTGASGSDINFEALDPPSGRGDGLPAISLASITHQRGRLHINAASDWDTGKEMRAPDTQGRRINSQFMEHLSSQNLPNDKERIADMAADMTDDSSELEELRGKVYRAVKRTYSSMFRTMMASLPHALKEHEVPYYIQAAMLKHDVENEEDLPPEYRPSESQVDDAVDEIRQMNTNTTTMSEWR